MDPEQTIAGLLSKNEQLGQENELLKFLFSVVKENIELRNRMQRFSIEPLDVSTGRKQTSLWKTTLGESHFRKNLDLTSLPHERKTSSPTHSRSFLPNTAHTDIYDKRESHRRQADEAFDRKGRKPTCLLKTTLDESHFKKNLDLTSLPHERKTSSPTHSRSFRPNTAHTDIYEKAESHSCQADVSLDGNDETLEEIALKVLGEIALQLDRRILSFVFQGHRRLYGFTVQNMPAKIIEVSTNLLTGKVEHGYRLYLTERYYDLMKQLNQLGYKKALHPLFSEFIVNKYGILKKRSQPLDYNNPVSLKKLILTTAPIKLQGNLLLLLKCLCNMADKDRRPLFLWKT